MIIFRRKSMTIVVPYFWKRITRKKIQLLFKWYIQTILFKTIFSTERSGKVF